MDDPLYWENRKAAVLQQLLQAKASWLGFTEPTLCSRAGLRIHEEHPEDTGTGTFRDSNKLLLEEAESSNIQHALGLVAANGLLALPRIVQYDLAHIVEQLPETREKATEDRQHTFLLREEANSVLAEHIRAYHQYGAIPALVWHAFHPIHGNKSIYEMPGIDPFAHTGTKGEEKLLRFLAKHIHIPEKEWKPSWSDQERSILGIMQAKLDRIAAFGKVLAAEEMVCLFRPYHEANGRWFWWSLKYFSEEENEAAAYFQELWCNTRRYLEDEKEVHNFLYVWSPNIDPAWFKPEQDLVSAYSRGIDIDKIDILGIDCYSNNFRYRPEQLLPHRQEVLMKGLSVIADLQRHFPEKPVGFTELGLRYHEALGKDDKEAVPGARHRGGGTLTTPFFKRFSKWAKHPPHFTIFWRNEPHSMEFPLAGKSKSMDEEVTGLFEYFDTIKIKYEANGLS